MSKMPFFQGVHVKGGLEFGCSMASEMRHSSLAICISTLHPCICASYHNYGTVFVNIQTQPSCAVCHTASVQTYVCMAGSDMHMSLQYVHNNRPVYNDCRSDCGKIGSRLRQQIKGMSVPCWAGSGNCQMPPKGGQAQDQQRGMPLGLLSTLLCRAALQMWPQLP